MSRAGIPRARLGRGDSRGTIAAWACNGCGAIQPRPCGLRGGKVDDFRPTRGLDGAPSPDWQERLAEVRAAGEFRPGPT